MIYQGRTKRGGQGATGPPTYFGGGANVSFGPPTVWLETFFGGGPTYVLAPPTVRSRGSTINWPPSVEPSYATLKDNYIDCHSKSESINICRMKNKREITRSEAYCHKKVSSLFLKIKHPVFRKSSNNWMIQTTSTCRLVVYQQSLGTQSSWRCHLAFQHQRKVIK